MGRMERVNQQLKREIGNIVLQELSDPRVAFVSIIGVNVSKDLRNARIYFSVIGNHDQIEHAQAALNSARGFIRKSVGQKMKIRNNPELTFTYDNSLEASARIDETIKEIHDD